MTAVAARPTFVLVGSTYRFTWPDLGIEIELDRLSDARDGLSAEITIYNSQPPSPGLLHAARFNLLSSPTRSALAKSLYARASDIAIETWADILEHLCFLTIQAYRAGAPTITLADVDWRTRPRWLLRPYIELGMGTVLFAKGGSGKSILALAMGIGICTGVPLLGTPMAKPMGTLLLDWESDAYAHAERLAALCRGAGIAVPRNLYYRRSIAPIAEASDYLGKEVARLGVGLVIVDAASAASGGESNEEGAVQQLFQAARSLQVSFLIVDHLAKTAQDTTMPIGHSQKAYQARLTWGIEQIQEEGDSKLLVALVNHKRNQGPLLKRRAYEISFDNDEQTEATDAITLRELDMLATPALAAKLPLKQRILAELRTGKLTADELAENLQVKPDQLRARLHDLRRGNKVVKLGADWGLAYIG